jgi:hypothetical protein
MLKRHARGGTARRWVAVEPVGGLLVWGKPGKVRKFLEQRAEVASAAGSSAAGLEAAPPPRGVSAIRLREISSVYLDPAAPLLTIAAARTQQTLRLDAGSENVCRAFIDGLTALCDLSTDR